MKNHTASKLLPLLIALLGCEIASSSPRVPPAGLPDPAAPQTRILNEDFRKKLSEAALERTKSKVAYNGKYLKIPYPLGDVPPEIGVCTDVVIRSYRRLGIDLQKEVHEDMRDNFPLYPKRWRLKAPDTNIDHRRVLNLEVFFARKGLEVAATRNPGDYLPGDIVTSTVGGNLPHIGIVVDKKAPDGTPLVVHNIGRGPRLENVLFAFPMTGHFRYAGPKPPHDAR